MLNDFKIACSLKVEETSRNMILSRN